MLQPGRNFNTGIYRFGMNGMESDPEISGNWGSHYTAEYWMYDARIGRRWETDPITYPWQSSYATFNNNPVYFVDPLGLKGSGPDDDEVPDAVNTPETSILLDPIEIKTEEHISDNTRANTNIVNITGMESMKLNNSWLNINLDGNYVDTQPSGLRITAQDGGGFNMTIATEVSDPETMSMTEMLFFRPGARGTKPLGNNAVPYLFEAGKNLIQTVTDEDVDHKV